MDNLEKANEIPLKSDNLLENADAVLENTRADYFKKHISLYRKLKKFAVVGSLLLVACLTINVSPTSNSSPEMSTEIPVSTPEADITKSELQKQFEHDYLVDPSVAHLTSEYDLSSDANGSMWKILNYTDHQIEPGSIEMIHRDVLEIAGNNNFIKDISVEYKGVTYGVTSEIRQNVKNRVAGFIPSDLSMPDGPEVFARTNFRQSGLDSNLNAISYIRVDKSNVATSNTNYSVEDCQQSVIFRPVPNNIDANFFIQEWMCNSIGYAIGDKTNGMSFQEHREHQRIIGMVFKELSDPVSPFEIPQTIYDEIEVSAPVIK